MKAKPAVCALFLLLLPAATPGRDGRILPWGDQGDGTYRNPVLKADYSDPDIIRRGDDFYLIASDFHFVGMQILHSRDLVNWTIVGQVFDRLEMDPKYDAMKGYAQGTWAPAIGYHDGTFYIFVCTPKDGLFMWHAPDMRGPWSKTVTVRAVEGWEDPCPFWDEDGTAYLVRSQVGAGPLILHRMSPDGTRLLDEGREIYRGPVAEGPKLFRRGGYYYISLPEGGVERGGQTVLRSQEIYGPYERREVLPPGSPHQGGMVTLENGEGWFVGFKSAGHLGRLCHLLPVSWTEEGWPVFGDGGKTVDRWRKPAVGGDYPIGRPETSDAFEARTLSPIWQWNHNPVPARWSLAARPGWLRLAALPAALLAEAPNTLTQKLWDDAGVVDVEMDAARMAEGDRAGFAFMSGSDFGWIGVEVRDGVRRIAWEGGSGPALLGDRVWLRGLYEGDRGRLLYSLDGRTFAETGTVFQLRFRHWKGARIAVFCYGSGGGAADFDHIRYRPGPSLEALIERMREHIEAVAGRYAGRVDAWDVVNEVIADDGSYRPTRWVEGVGDGDLLVKSAFRFAARYAPDAQLYYNDFNAWRPSKRDGIVRLVRMLQEEGIRIDGVGMQGHWGLHYPRTEYVEAAIDAYAALGVKVMITELDVDVLPLTREGQIIGSVMSHAQFQLEEFKAYLDPYAGGLPEQVEEELADRYETLFRIFHGRRDKIDRVTFWGVHDGMSWKNDYPVPGRTNYPLLYRRDGRPRPALDRLLRLPSRRP